MSVSGETCEKWRGVTFTADNESVFGTLFLLSPNSEEKVIQWIADSGNLSESHNPPKIPLSSITRVERCRLSFTRYTSIFIRTKQNEVYGPFEFTQGGSRDFLDKLRLYVDLQPISSYPETYKVTRKTKAYQLPSSDFSSSPMSVIQEVGTRLMNAFEGLRVSADMALNEGVYASPDMRRRSPDPASAFLDPEMNLVTAQRLIASDRLPSITEDSFTAFTAPDDADYQLVSRAPRPISLPDIKPVLRKHPVGFEEWRRHLDRDGRVTVVEKLQNNIFNGGIEPDLRPIAWKYLFGYLKWDFTEEENEKRIADKHQHYNIMRTFWRSMSRKQILNFRTFRERKSIIEKDTYRTDRQTSIFKDDSAGALTRLYNILVTYTFYNPDLGYFQGMNDLLAVIMTVIDEEEDAFWCFAGLLDRLSGHFSDGPSSLSNQFSNLFKVIEILMPRFAHFLREKEATSMSFCFKWFLIIFKREFSYDDIKILWEALFSGVAPKNFQLLIAVAIFDAEADEIMRNCSDISQILQYINGLSEKINLQNVLSRAQGIFNQLAEVKDRLPTQVAVCFGFALPTRSSSDMRLQDRVNTEAESVEFNFQPNPASFATPIPTVTASFSASSDPSDSSLELGEDVAVSADQRCSPDSGCRLHGDIFS